MTDSGHRRGALAVAYERVRRPEAVLAAMVLLLYAPSVPGDFALDDHRCVRLLRDCAEGQADTPQVYEFLYGGEQNAEARRAGWYPWWVQDEVRYRHLRPVAEWLLYGQYRLFGERPEAYRLTAMALYTLGIVLVLALYRVVGGDERVARWGAAVFAVAACHAVPVAFISAEADVLALVCVVGAMLGCARFVRPGGLGWLGGAWFCYIVALFTKESALPAAAWPLVFLLGLDRGGGMRVGGLLGRSDRSDSVGAGAGKQGVGGECAGKRAVVEGIGVAGFSPRAVRAVLATGLLGLSGLAWLGYYAAGGYGSNAMPMLDPLHAPGAYLAALPGRAVLLMTAWLVPLNPFLFWFFPGWQAGAYVFGGAGLVCLVLLGRMFWRRHRAQRGVASMALLAGSFLPLLVCTVPDDRVMILPSIGLAYLAACWMTRPRDACAKGVPALRRLPLVLFVGLQAAAVPTAYGLMRFMEAEAQGHLRVMVDGFGRDLRRGDHVFLLNTARNFEVLFAQDRLARIEAGADIRVSALADIAGVRVEAAAPNRLRISGKDEPLLSSFSGRMGTARGVPRRSGDVVELDDFAVELVDVRDGAVWAIEVCFRKPLGDDSHRFYWSSPDGPPERWDGLEIGDHPALLKSPRDWEQSDERDHAMR